MKRIAALALAALAAAAAASAQAQSDDPVVARVNGAAVLRSDVMAAHRSLPAQVQQMPIEMIFPLLVDQVVNGRIIAEAGRAQNLQNDPEVKSQLARLEDRLIERTYLSRVIADAVTDDKIKARHAENAKKAPKCEEVKASHILVEKEDDAKKVIADLKRGGDFERIARERSIDPGGKQNGGDLGFFTREQMVPEFADAAFKMKKGETSEAPVKSQFGWHVIRVTDRRQIAAPSLEESKAELQEELSREAVEEHIQKLRAAAKVELFNLDGTPAVPNKQ
ncbi:MAG: peptidylprolyl isomerase [Alphaproteobacteria bacterium]